MDVPLNVLILEDRPADAELMVEALRKAGFAPQWRRVDTELEYLAALDPNLDVILSDHALPQFNSVRALERLQERGFDVPFIIVSSTIGEEQAVAFMKQGAADYLLKDRLSRLGQAVLHAVRQKQLRQDKRRIEQALKDEQAWFRELTNNIHDCIVVLDASGKVTYATPSSVQLMGYEPKMLVGSDGFENVHPDDLPAVLQQFQALRAGSVSLVTATVRVRHADGSWRYLEVLATNRLTQAPINGIILTYRDVTENKRAAEQLLLREAALAATANSIVLTDRNGAIVWTNEAFTQLTGYAFEEVRGKNARVLKSNIQEPDFYEDLWRPITAGKVWHGELINRRKDGSLYAEEMTITPVCARGAEITHFIAIKQDITARKQSEEALRESEHHFRALFENMLNAFVYARMVFEEGRPSDYIYLGVNGAFESLTGLKNATGKLASEIIPGIREADPELFDILGRVARTGKPERFEIYLRSLKMWVAIGAYRPEKDHFVAVFDVITERKQAEASLRASEAKLNAISAAALDAIIMIDGDGNFIFWNWAAERILGYSAAEVMGKSLHSLLTPQHIKPDFDKGLATFKQTGQGPLVDKVVEVLATHRDGHEFPVEVSVGSIRLNDQWCAVAVMRDVTERKKIEAEKRGLIDILETTPDFVGTFSLDERWVYLNAGGRALLGIGADEDVLSLRNADLQPAWANRLIKEEGIPKAMRQGHWRGEAALLARDGREIPILVSLLVHKSAAGEVEYVSIVGHDISIRKQTELALAEHAKLDALMADVSTSLVRETSLHGILHRCAQALVRHLDAAFARIWTMNSTSDTLELQASAGLYTHLDGAHARVSVGQYKIGLIAQERKPHFTNRVIGDPRVHCQEWARREGIVAFAGHPMMDGAKLRGVMAVFSRKALSASTLNRLTVVANQIALGIGRKQAEDELRSSEERFALAVDGANDGIWDWNFVTKKVYFSPRCKAMIGYADHEIDGRFVEWQQRVHPDDQAGTMAQLRAYLKKRIPIYQPEYRLRRKDGSYCWILARAKAIWDENGKPIRLTGSHTDITNRKKAEDELRLSEERFRRITTNMLDLVVQVNPEGIYEYVTPSTLSVLGYQSEDLLGRSFLPLLHPDDLQNAALAFKTAMESGVPSLGEYRFRKGNGEYLWLEVVGKRLLDEQGRVCGVLVASRDVTTRRQAEDKIRQLNAALEQKVRDRTAQLEAANKELESFAYSISHDLRAPLRGIDGFSQALLEDYNDKLDANGQDYLRRVRAATQRMGHLIDDILQLSRLNRSAMKREKVNLSVIAERVMERLQVAEPARHVEICITPVVTVDGDPSLLDVMLTNLLGNAWKFTSKTENARIEFGVTESHDKCAFFVRDNGAGFDMANVNRLFGAFQRLHSETEFSGLGIGLATVQRIIHRHGGEIWAEGAVDKGATFYFTLPPAPQPRCPDEGPAEAAVCGAKESS